ITPGKWARLYFCCVKKATRWSCKLCGEKQSLLKKTLVSSFLLAGWFQCIPRNSSIPGPPHRFPRKSALYLFYVIKKKKSW
uniref:Uncharacterized protein n=1 Tax=Anabas testudineus TaxID=64144 RepID=A0AAQ6IS68_ANATE